MKRPSNVTLSLLAGLVVMGVLAALAARPGESAWWTDGDAIRVPGAGAPVREVLWRPATRLRADGPVTADEYEPRYSADGTLVVFVRGRPGQNADLYTSRWSPQGWTTPQPLKEVNTPEDELGPELSRDGTSLYFYSDREGGLGGYDLWVSQRTADAWGTPTNLGPGVNTRFNEYGPALTPGGERLYFSSNRAREGEPEPSGEAWSATVRERRTRHDYDLYVADLGPGGHAEPVAGTNTGADEGAPAISPAGDFLYFASDRAGGHGGFDLYRMRLIPAGRTGAIENLGTGINSGFNELDPALSSDGFRLTFSSDRELPEPVPGSSERAGRVEAGTAGLYSLWTSTSREVYRDTEARESRLLAALRELLPWLLLLLLTLAPLLLLFRLLRNPQWRGRFARLSLLAQCLLLSLLVHAGVASVFTVWKVGTGVIDLLNREPGGGTRVIVSSGVEGGSLTSQVRAGSTQLEVPAPELPDSGASLPTPLLEASFVTPSLPRVRVPDTPPPVVEVAQGARTPTTTGPAGVQSVPEPVTTEIAAVPAGTSPGPARSEPSTVMAAKDLKGEAPAAVAGTGGDAVPVSLAIPPLAKAGDAGPLGGNAVPDPRSHELGPSGPGAVLNPAVQPGVGDAASIPAVASARAAKPEATGAVSPGASVPGVTAPAVGLQVASSAVSVQLPPVGGREHGEALGSSEVTLAVPRPVAEAAPLPMTTPGDQGAVARAGEGVAVPAAGTRAANVEEGGPGVPGGAVSLPPAVPGVLGEPGVETVQISPGMVRTPEALRGAPLGAPLSLNLRPPDLNAGVPGAAPPPTRGASQIPVGIPVPLESFAQRAPETRAELVERMGGSAETERAVGLALDWFLEHQSPDGHWSAQHFDDRCKQCSGPAEVKADAAMTGLVLLCYLGAGHTHQQESPYRGAVARGISWLVGRQGPDGDLRAGETMYGQTVAAVALCEAFAMTRDPALAEPARKAVEFVLARANKSGRADDRDTSVIGWLVFTVESARRAGFAVPQSTFEAARGWLGQVADPAAPGRYAYARGQPASASMTAEAMFVQQLLGRGRTEPVMEQSARFVLSRPPRWGEGAPTHSWYYATLALFQHQGDAWKQWNERLVAELLGHQEREGALKGSWAPTDEWSRLGGRVYQTAVCTLSLEVYYRYAAR